MAKRLSLLALVLLLAIVAAPFAAVEADTSGRSTPCAGSICISEILVDAKQPPGTTKENGAVGPNHEQGEWVELVNIGNSPVDLMGWVITDDTAGHDLIVDPIHITSSSNSANPTLLDPGQYLVVAVNGTETSCGFCLRNSGEEVSLKDKSGSTVHVAEWNSAPGAGNTITADQSDPTADWGVFYQTPTPGLPNGGGTPINYVDTDLEITELMPNPVGLDTAPLPEGEWIELHNVGNGPLDLSNWRIESDTGGVIDPLDENKIPNWQTRPVLNPGQYIIAYSNGTSMLRNSGGAIHIVAADGSKEAPVSWNRSYQNVPMIQNPLNSTAPFWTSPLATPGLPNMFMPSMVINASDPRVELSEIMPDPSTSDLAPHPDGEWLEIHVNATNMSLAGWGVMGAAGTFIPITASNLVGANASASDPLLIQNESWVVIQANGSDMVLNDDFDYLHLVNPAGAIIDTAYWLNPNDDASVGRSGGPDDMWQPNQYVTPGLPNDYTEPVIESDVWISEVMPNPWGADTAPASGGEWVELYNNGSNPINLSGWKLVAKFVVSLTINSASVPEAIHDSSALTLDSKSYMLVWRNGAGFSLGNAAENLALRDASGNTVDLVNWTADKDLDSGVSFYRENHNSSELVRSLLPTPNQSNTFTPYIGPTTLRIDEAMARCQNPPTEIGSGLDWVELVNTGTVPMNASRWIIEVPNGNQYHVLPRYVWPDVEEDGASTIINSGERLVVTLPWTALNGAGDQIRLLDPDGNEVGNQTLIGFAAECAPYVVDSTDSSHLIVGLEATPGEANPDTSGVRTTGGVLISKIMPRYSDENSVTGPLDEMIELANIGEGTVNLAGWTIKREGTVNSELRISEMTFSPILIEEGKRLIISSDVTNLTREMGVTVASPETVFCGSCWMPSFYDTGSTISILDGSGATMDVLAYGNAPIPNDGWTGSPAAMPHSPMNGVIMVRGDGCGDLADTNTAQDWMNMSHAMMNPTCGMWFDANGSITPIIGPSNALGEVINWINQATTSLHLQLYWFESLHLLKAVEDRLAAGVEVTIVLDEEPYDIDAQKRTYLSDIADRLQASGATILRWGDGDDSQSGDLPGRWLHSKIAVRDESSVLLGSGNWKDSSLPPDGNTGNREWFVEVTSAEVLQELLPQLAIDADPRRGIVSPHTSSSQTIGEPTGSATVQAASQSISGSFRARWLTCPSDCWSGITDAIEGAEKNIRIQVPKISPDWGDEPSPLLSTLKDAAARGVQIEILLDGYCYRNPAGDCASQTDTRTVIHEINEQWNRTLGYNVEARIMASDDVIYKIHNKGMIIDGKQTLVGSINWNENSILRNREHAILIDNSAVAEIYVAAFMHDWNLIDEVTDSDSDGLPDKWEILHGFDRVISTVNGSNQNQGEIDSDGDGLMNLDEWTYGGDPHNNDTDGDCLEDGDEKWWAIKEGISVADAISLVDADKDGIEDGIAQGCRVEIPDTNSGTNTTDTNSDAKTGGESGNLAGSEDDDSGSLTNILIGIIALSAIVLLVSLYFIFNNQSGNLGDKMSAELDLENASMAVHGFSAENLPDVELSGHSAPTFDGFKPPFTDSLSHIPQDQVDAYRKGGWSDEQIKEQWDRDGHL